MNSFFQKCLLTLTCARANHWMKNIFILPGFAMALVIESITLNSFLSLFIAIVAVNFLASANYSLNEIFDKELDKFHPHKKERPLAKGLIPSYYVFVQYILCVAFGLFLSTYLKPMFFYLSILFLAMALVYNIPPIRAKEIPFIDVLVEAFNNPIRLSLGWASICSIIFPPLSFAICYWFGGAFLMAMKRYSEYKFINNKVASIKYRKSFIYYNETNLILCSFFYALVSVFFLGIFIVKYYIEFILAFPLISFLFIWYAYLAIDKNNDNGISTGKLLRNRPFILYCILTGLLTISLFFVDIPFLDHFTDHTYLNDIRIN